MTEIRLWNTRDREQQRVVPRNGRVGMYVCGPTVYDRAHIGNARPAVVFDVLFRLLRHVHGAENVTYVSNITDIDDKINARAAQSRGEGESILDAVKRITTETTAWYREDMGALGCLEPDVRPLATQFVHAPGAPTDMIRMIELLIEKGHAYAAEGHVLFSVRSWEGYGSLSRRSTDELLAGARVDVAPYKRDAMDFVLWKPSTEDQPGWESPWGRGRPGWHIECSAMAKAILGPEFGDRFQIHGGGIDLVFPHHENERAQSCAAHGGDDMADIWMHNGYLMVEGEKMSKSLGNFITVWDLRGKVSGPVIRRVLLSTHYRSPLDWTAKRVEEAKTVINRWGRLFTQKRRADLNVPPNFTAHPEVLAALADDLNTAEALRVVDELAKDWRAETDEDRLIEFIGNAALLGFDAEGGSAADPSHAVSAAIDAVLDGMCRELDEARNAKDFATADRLRAEMQAMGAEVQTTKDGTRWFPTAGVQKEPTT
ncbi:MAG: cysteine--tRNA ligase [Pseudomonadota bacterium]